MHRSTLSRAVILLLTLTFSACLSAEEVWIDVRSSAEHSMDSIEGDMRVDHDSIVPAIREKFPDRNTEIHLYCASGGRAGKAKASLEKAGYEAVYNAGGIDDAREERGIAE